MKRILFCTVGVVAFGCYGGLFDSALKAVNKAAEVANEVDTVKKTVTEKPQETIPQTPVPQMATPQASAVNAAPAPEKKETAVSASTLKWDAAGYEAKVDQVKKAMPDVSQKLPLQGDPNTWYGAAYELTTIDKQYGFMTLEQRISRVSAKMRGNVDKFLAWVGDGMPVDAASAQSPKTASANASTTNNGLSEDEAKAVHEQFQQKINDACAKGLKIYPPQTTWGGGYWKFTGKTSSEIQEWTQELDDVIAEAEAKKASKAQAAEAEKAAAEAQKKALLDERKELVAKMESFIAKFKSEFDLCKKAANDILAKYSVVVTEYDRNSLEGSFRQNCDLNKMYGTREYLEAKAEGIYEKEDGDLKMDVSHLKNWLTAVGELPQGASEASASESPRGRTQRENLRSDDMSLEADRNAPIVAGGLEGITIQQLKDHAVTEIGSLFRNILKKLDEKIASELNLGREKHLITDAYAAQITEQKTANAKSADKLMATLEEVHSKVGKVLEQREAEDAALKPAIDYASNNCRSGEFTAEKRAKLLELLKGKTQEDFARFVRERNDMLFWVSVELITDQKILEDLLVTDTKWLHGGYRDGMTASDFRDAYYKLYKYVTDQDLLMKLLAQPEISFSTQSSSVYGYRDPVVFSQLDAEHLAMLNRQRVARRRAAQGKTIDVFGFYIGMPRQDCALLMFMKKLTDDDVSCSYGTWKRGPVDKIWFSKAYCAKEMGITDGIVGLSLFTEKFVPGGDDNAGEIHANADVKDTYDIENEEVGARVDTFWWRSCPKFGCEIKMYDGGNLVINAEKRDVKLDLSAADALMNEDFDESDLDDYDGNSSSGGVLLWIVVLLGCAGGGFYFFRKRKMRTPAGQK